MTLPSSSQTLSSSMSCMLLNPFTGILKLNAFSVSDYQFNSFFRFQFLNKVLSFLFTFLNIWFIILKPLPVICNIWHSMVSLPSYLVTWSCLLMPLLILYWIKVWHSRHWKVSSPPDKHELFLCFIFKTSEHLTLIRNWDQRRPALVWGGFHPPPAHLLLRCSMAPFNCDTEVFSDTVPMGLEH